MTFNQFKIWLIVGKLLVALCGVSDGAEPERLTPKQAENVRQIRHSVRYLIADARNAGEPHFSIISGRGWAIERQAAFLLGEEPDWEGAHSLRWSWSTGHVKYPPEKQTGATMGSKFPQPAPKPVSKPQTSPPPPPDKRCKHCGKPT